MVTGHRVTVSSKLRTQAPPAVPPSCLGQCLAPSLQAGLRPRWRALPVSPGDASPHVPALRLGSRSLLVPNQSVLPGMFLMCCCFIYLFFYALLF